MDKKIYSPDQKQCINFKYLSEIRFGPPFFAVFIDDKKITDRVFGNEHQWSADSQYLALQEWLTTHESTGPRTRLFLINLDLMEYSGFKTVMQGFATSFIFTQQSIFYKKNYKGSGRIVEVEIYFNDIHNWKPLPLNKSSG